MPKYFEYEDLKEFLGVDPSLEFKLVRTDTYDEQKIKKAVKDTGMVNELKCCAIQTALVGTGNQELGSVMLKSDEVSVKQIYKDAGVKTNLPPTSKLEESDLTPRRLQRFFRYTIHEYMKTYEIPSYLYTKYSDHDERFRLEIFPGAEHMVTDPDIAKYLYTTYLRLDFQLNTTISDRVYRVLVSRNILPMKSMDTWKKEFADLKRSLEMKSVKILSESF